MQKRLLGKSGIEVSRLGLGSLTMAKLQKNSSKKEIEAVICECVANGINFVDGAELYGCYDVLREFVRQNKEVVIASKSYAYDEKSARKAVEEHLREIGRDYIDVFLMHEQEDEWTIRGHKEAFEFYEKMKREGKIRAIGVSTHRITCVKDCLKFPWIDVVHPLINYKGYGLFDGTREDMENAIRACHEKGIGTYSMKVFGGGHLLGDRKQAVDYILSKDFIDSSVVGMATIEEVRHNVALFEGSDMGVTPPDIAKKRVQIQYWCEKCLKCAAVCPQNAIHLVGENVTIDEDKCVLCGYCGSACENMCIKLY